MSNTEAQRLAYNKHFEEYEEVVNAVHQRFKPYSIDAWLPQCAGKRILDLGCGNGYVLRELIAAGIPFEYYTGVDIADEMVENNRHVFYTSTNVEFIVDDAHTLGNIPNDAYDVVISYGCLHHLDAPEKAIRALSFKLRAGGVLFALELNRSHPTASFFGVWAAMIGLEPPKVLAFKDRIKKYIEPHNCTEDDTSYIAAHPGHPGKRTPDEYRRDLSEAGFRSSDVSCMYIETLPYRLYSLHRDLFRFMVRLSKQFGASSALRDTGPVLLITAIR